MRIVIDLQGAQSESRYRGIGRYTLALALTAAKRSRGHDIHVILNGAFADTISAIRDAFEGVLPSSSIHVFHVPLPVNGMHAENTLRIERAELIREAAIAALAPDLIHVSSLFEGYGDDSVTSVKTLLEVPTLVTLYDLIPYLNPAIYLDPVPPYRTFYERKLAALLRADGLVAISESAAAEVVDGFGFDSGRVSNISAACDPVFKPMSPASPIVKLVQQKYGLGTDFILYTGGSDDRKNLRRLVDAYARLEWRQRMRCRLVLAGRMHQPHVDELRARAAAGGMGQDELIFTGYVSDNHLVALYNLCRFFIFPSWHEGFGLPALEAMSCGAAVLASDASSIREVAQCKEALFDPMDVESMRDRMAHYLDSDEDLERLRRYSLERAKDFSWPLVADRFLDACEEVHARSAHPTLPDEARLLGYLTERVMETGISADELLGVADSIDKSLKPPLPKIMVDVTELAAHDHKTGIQRVTRAIIAEWKQRPPSGYMIQLVRMDREARTYVCADQYAAQLWGEGQEVPDTPLVCHSGDVFLGLDLVGDSVALVPDWFNYFRSTGVRIAFVVYDIIPIRHPEWWPADGHRHHERWLRGIVAQSDALLCISNATADDVVAWMDAHSIECRPQIRWFHLGADIQGSMASFGAHENGDLVLSRLAGGISFLMVGTLEPRKGHAQVLDAFEELWAAGREFCLVIVGKRGWLVNELADRLSTHPEKDKRLIWLTGVSDEFLDELYSACSCLLTASEAEGFGLPLIEAAQRGLPIVARDIPVFREVAGESAYYFADGAPAALAADLENWAALYREGRHPSQEGMAWLTWQQSAAQLSKVLLEGGDSTSPSHGKKESAGESY